MERAPRGGSGAPSGRGPIVTARMLAATSVVEALLALAIGAVALDMRAHYRVEDLGGVNVWGYRGPVMNQKGPNEVRIAMAGGDLAFGWGVAANETAPYFLRQLATLALDRGAAKINVTAVNIAARGLDAADYAAWIGRYSSLQPDVICLLPDPGQHQLADGRFLPDRGSRLFETFGYSPILPFVLQEKGALTRSASLAFAGAALERLDPHVSASARHGVDMPTAVADAIAAALGVARIGVVFIVPPGLSPTVATADTSSGRLRIVDLSTAPIMRDPALRLDGYALSVAGHSRAADAIAPAVIDLIRASGRVRS
jgi:hypothetical protein